MAPSSNWTGHRSSKARMLGSNPSGATKRMGCFSGRKVQTVNLVNESSIVGSTPTLSSKRRVTLNPDKIATGNW